jgi:hypothetical protein
MFENVTLSNELLLSPFFFFSDFLTLGGVFSEGKLVIEKCFTPSNFDEVLLVNSTPSSSAYFALDLALV